MNNSQHATKSKSDERNVINVFSPLMKWAASSILLMFFIGAIVTLSIFMSRHKVSTNFVESLITLDGVLLALVSLFLPIAYRGSKASEFAKKVSQLRVEAQKNALDDFQITSILVVDSVLQVLIPLTASLPFVVAGLIDLAALLNHGWTRIYLVAIAFWIMLSSFLSVVGIFWKMALTLWKLYWAGFESRHNLKV
jgi:hypothetical protein